MCVGWQSGTYNGTQTAAVQVVWLQIKAKHMKDPVINDSCIQGVLKRDLLSGAGHGPLALLRMVPADNRSIIPIVLQVSAWS